MTVADFTIDRPGLLEINRKIATMGGGDSHRVKKKASLCSASVCFFGGFGRFEIEGLPPQKKILAGRLGLDPLTTEVSPDLGEFTEIQDDVSVEMIPLRYR